MESQQAARSLRSTVALNNTMASLLLPSLARAGVTRATALAPVLRRPLTLAAVRPRQPACRTAALLGCRHGDCGGALRLFATEAPKEDEAAAKDEAAEGEAAAEGAGETEPAEAGADAAAEPEDPIAALTAELEAEQAERAAAEEKTGEYKDAMLRALADAENARSIARRDVENARKFGIQNFAKDILDVADNLERAMDSVPEELRKMGEEPSPSATALVSLYDGVSMTEKQMQSIMGRFGISKVDPLGEKVDPNRHDVKVNLPAGSGACDCASDTDTRRCCRRRRGWLQLTCLDMLCCCAGDPGTVGLVIRPGYVLDDRVLRAAEVGVCQ
jgi:molecular chaperone GrpE